MQTPGKSSLAELRGAALFTAAYMAVAIAGAIRSGNREFLFYITVMLLLMAAVGAVHLRVHLSQRVLWGLSTWGLLHMAGGLLPVPRSWPIHGEIRVLYSWWIVPDYLKYDHVVHAYGFGITTLLCWEGLRAIVAAQSGRERRTVAPTPGMLTLCGAASMGFGALNEVIEFAATLLVPETNVGDYANTSWDLVSNLAGIVVAVLLIHRADRIRAARTFSAG